MSEPADPLATAIYLVRQDRPVRVADPEPPSAWCVVANVPRSPRPEGPDRELRLGTRRFAPGAKIYLGRPSWGDGGERVYALGRHRGGGRRLIAIVVRADRLENFRARRVFHPHVVESMNDLHPRWDEESANEMAASWNSRTRPSETPTTGGRP